MNILALESSATACSVALCRDEALVAQSFQNNGLTHSRTLMPMLEQMLAACSVTLEEVDLIAVAAGPGSFTGLRIGVSAAKGLAWPGNKPCAACSTLESMAWLLAHTGMEICPVMDARRSQVYNARFQGTGQGLVRLCPDRAVGLDELAAELKKSGNPQILVGDGAVLCYTTLKEQGLDVRLPPPHLLHQCAWGVARCALELSRAGALTDAAGLTPSYHRLSQAERERLAKEHHKGD
jgi:tRNA threonylcarbamoyladenosine biosynthesis protein TsaB